MTGSHLRQEDVAWGATGLVPAVVQDAADGRVLMVAYVDAEALAASLASGEVHFHSRSRDRLWRKGETSGNVLRLRDISIDCDGDALLIQADPVGPTCHRGTHSCFDPADAVEATPPAVAASAWANPPPAQGFAWLETLWATIDERASADPATSYTARLIAGGADAPARKVAEEATEVLMAAKDDAVATPPSRQATRDALTGEVADLLYHTLVVLRERGLPPSAVIARLRERHQN
jgi:phosphoribosyl-ATP pyrophosphohydrolase/phosphoribosyl-AMP cyclohydrolase